MALYNPLEGVTVIQRPNVRPGGFIIVDRSTVAVRHMSELLTWIRCAEWHVNRSSCPTWDDSTECRCMTEERR